LGEEAACYKSLARLLGWVRGWRASESYDQEGTLSLYHTREMAWCASSQLSSFGACRFRFSYGAFPRCSLCPLFDPKRALLDSLGENRPAGMVFEINLHPDLRALLQAEPPPGLELGWRAPDYPPQEWGDNNGEESPG